MSTNNMDDHRNILLLKDFRLKYGFTQPEMARYLKTTRSQVSMAELFQRPLSPQSESLFLSLQQLLDELSAASGGVVKDALGESGIDDSRWQEFADQCHGKLVRMRYEKRSLELELPILVESAMTAASVISRWQAILNNLPENDLLTNSPEEMIERSKQKLITCDEVVQLTRQLQIKILSAGVEVLSHFLAEHGL